MALSLASWLCKQGEIFDTRDGNSLVWFCAAACCISNKMSTANTLVIAFQIQTSTMTAERARSDGRDKT